MDSYKINVGTGRGKVTLNVAFTEEGISVLLTGGEKPHVGGVVVAMPRQSLTGTGVSSDFWVVPVPGHKDVVAAQNVAGLISNSTGQVVAVTAGIHIDGAKKEELAAIQENCQEAAAIVVEKYQTKKRGI